MERTVLSSSAASSSLKGKQEKEGAAAIN